MSTQEQAMRCSMCNLDFPVQGKYRLCTECDQPTSRTGGVTPMPKDQAQSLLNHANFEKYLAEQGRS